MPQQFNLLVDDHDSQINYLCPTEQQQGLAGAYSNRTWTTISDPSCKKGWFNYLFLGTGIHIHIPTSSTAESAAVLLDNKLLEPDENGIFEAHDLPDGQHNFTYGIGDVSTFPMFDYLTITAGPSTPLKGKTLVVDDADSSLEYSGSWIPNDPKPSYYDYSTRLFGDTVHWTSSIGDTVQFKFIGTSVAVYGLAANITSGNITASYTIDGVTSVRPLPRGTLDSIPMTEFFRAADLQPGTHTLLINLTDIASPRRYGIDFIAYNTSAERVTEFPGFQAPVGNAATPESDGSGSGKGGNIVRNAILGGVLGGVGFLLLIGLVFLVMRRRSRKGVQLAEDQGSYEDITDKQSTLNQPPVDRQ